MSAPWERATDRFVRRENSKHYRDVLERPTDATERRRIQKLLDAELLKQKAAGDDEAEAKQALNLLDLR